MVVQAPVRVRSLHHGAIPVADLGRAYRFYMQVLGARLERILNATPWALQRGLPEFALVELGGRAGFGLVLQYQPIPERKLTDGPSWGLEATPEELQRVEAALAQFGVAAAQPASLSDDFPLRPVLAFQDMDGNAWEVCASRDTAESASSLTLRYASLEVTDLPQAEAYYTGVLGLNCAARTENLLVLRIDASDQWIVLRKVARMSEAVDLIKGPHVAIEVDAETFDAVYPSFSRREQYWERETTRTPWQEPYQRVGYFYDPFHNRLALVAP